MKVRDAEAEKDKKDEIQLQVEEPPQEIVEEKKPSAAGKLRSHD